MMFLTALGLRICRVTCPCKSVQETLAVSAVFSSTLTFIHGTFFEIIVCVSVSMSMIPFLQRDNLLNDADRLSCAFAIFFGAIMAAYTSFVLYFLACKSRALADYHQSQVEEKNLDRAETFY